MSFSPDLQLNVPIIEEVGLKFVENLLVQATLNLMQINIITSYVRNEDEVPQYLVNQRKKLEEDIAKLESQIKEYKSKSQKGGAKKLSKKGTKKGSKKKSKKGSKKY